MSRSILYRYRIFFRVMLIVAIVSIYILSMLPQNQVPYTSWSDKVNHTFAFLVLGLLIRLAYRISYWQALASLVVFGAFIEFSQYFTPTRAAELADIGADTIGVFIGLKLYKYIYRFFR